MTFMTLIGIWVVWLIIGGLILRFILGGAIDCFKRGKQAPLSSWTGLFLLILLLVLIL